MADSVDPIVIPIQVDDKSSLMSIETLQTNVTELTSQLAELKKQSASPMADYTRDFNQQISFAEQSLTRLLALRNKVDASANSSERSRSTQVFEDEYKRVGLVVEDLQQSMFATKKLFSSFSDGLEKEFTEGIKTFAPRIKQAFRQMTDSITKTSGANDDDSLINIFQHSDVYKNTMKALQSRNAAVFNDATMKNYLRAITATAIPQYNRNKFVDWGSRIEASRNVRDLLPKSFSKIQLSGEKTYAPFQQRTKALTSAETNALQKLIRDNPYVANELEQAGIMRRYNGMAYYNPNTRRANVNAFAGLMANMFEVGARGGPSGGIANIEDPNVRAKILRKSNMYMDNSMRVANTLADIFPWLNPQHMQVPHDPNFRPSVNGQPGNWKTLGEYRAKPRQTAMEFYEFGLDEFGENGQVVFKKNPKYTRVNNSLMQSMLSSQMGATPFSHNGFNNNEIYLSMPVDELSDFRTTPERKKELQAQISKAIQMNPQIGGYRYKFGGFTPTHAVFEREDLYDQIVANSPNYFMNGEDRKTFSSYKDFSKALENARKLRTEGEDIRNLYGSDLSKAQVVVARMKDITGLDGQNWIDSKLVPESFQGRDFGGKSTFSKVDISALWNMYPQLVDKKTGNLVLPTGGLAGGQLVIPRGTSIIEDIENIKTKHQYDGLSQDEINALRTQEIQTNGLFAKTTASAASTAPRYISSQAAGTMHFNADARRFFNSVFMRELASLEDVGAVKELLFSGNDPLSQMVQRDESILNSPEARQRIDEYRNSLFSHAEKGDVLIPRGSANYAMISAWLPDVMASLIPEDQLTDLQKSWRLADINKNTGGLAGVGTESADIFSQVAYFASKADELGLYRNPATASGNLKISNRAIDSNMQSIAKALGVDTSALYIDPKSVILALMQGADEDGDTAFVAALKHNKEFGDIMSQVLIDTASAYKQMRELGDRTDEQQKAFADLHTKDITGGKDSFDITNMDDLAAWYVGSKVAGSRMGAANAVSVGARQLRPSQLMARAILDAESDYDISSVGALKAAKEFQTTDDEWKILGMGAPLFQLANWAQKSLTAVTNENGQDELVLNQDAFNQRQIDKVNFTSMHDTHAVMEEYSRFLAHMNHPEQKGDYDWDTIFGNLPAVNTNTATGQLTSRLRELKLGRMNNDFLFFDDATVDELLALRSNAHAEISRDVLADATIPNAAKAKEVRERLSRAGGDVVNNLVSFGLTRRNLMNNPELKQDLEFMQEVAANNGLSLFSKAKDFTLNQNAPTSFESYVEKEREAVVAQISQLEAQRNANQQQIAQIEQTSNATTDQIDSQQQLKTNNDDLSKQIEALQQKQEQFTQIGTYNEKYNAVQAEYNRLVSDSSQFSSDLFKSVMQKQNRIDGVSRAQTFYNSHHGIANAYARQFDNLINNDGGMLNGDQLENLMKLKQRITTNADKEFAAQAVLNAKQLSENLTEKAAPAGGIWGAQEKQLDSYMEKIQEANEYKNILLGLSNDPKVDSKTQDEFKQAAGRVSEYLKTSQEQYEKYRDKLTAENQIIEAQRINQENARVDQIAAQGRQLSFNRGGARNDVISRIQQQRFGILSQYSSYISSGENALSELRRRHLNQAEGSDEYVATAKNIETLENSLSDAREEMESFSGASGLAKVALIQFGSVTQKTVSQFGKQMFHKALQEAKKFVVEYDKSMTEIQMITLKSDDQINSLGQHLIQTSLDMKTSVSDTTTAAADLYRQGLSDDEVDDRLEDVLMFSKVAGIKSQEASKIITTALQNGLVDSSTEAMDALVALGDSAATTASEIAKGMQKSAAAAKEANVSYGQLVTLLTLGTSKTQLGGGNIGSALQTIFYRLYKVNNGEDFYDENGNHIASTAATKALKQMGVDIFNDDGTFRGAYDVLMNIASNWDSADDVTQSMILSTLGAGRQRTNVATLLQGLAEDNGELAGRYLNLAENSNGITDTKYVAYMNSLEASVQGVQTAFDQLISTLNAGNAASGVLDWVTELIQGFTSLQEATNGLLLLIPLLGAAVAAVVANPVMAAIIGGTALIAGIAGSIGNAISDAKQAKIEASSEYKYAQQVKEDKRKYETFTNGGKQSLDQYSVLIEETKALGEEYTRLGDQMNEADTAQLESNLRALISIFPELGTSIGETTDVLSNWAAIVDGASESAGNIKNATLETAKALATRVYATIDRDTREQVQEIKNSLPSIGGDSNISWNLTGQNGKKTSDQNYDEFILAATQLDFESFLKDRNIDPIDFYRKYFNTDESSYQLYNPLGEMYRSGDYSSLVRAIVQSSPRFTGSNHYQYGQTTNEIVDLFSKIGLGRATFSDYDDILELFGIDLNDYKLGDNEATNLGTVERSKFYSRIMSHDITTDDEDTLQNLFGLKILDYIFDPEEKNDLDFRGMAEDAANNIRFNNNALYQEVLRKFADGEINGYFTNFPTRLSNAAFRNLQATSFDNGADLWNETQYIKSGMSPLDMDAISFILNADKNGHVMYNGSSVGYIPEVANSKRIYESSLRYLYGIGRISNLKLGTAENPIAYASTDEFIEDYLNGFTQLNYSQVRVIEDELHKFLNDSTGLRSGLELEQDEQINAIWEQAIDQYFENNPIRRFTDNLDDMAKDAIISKIKSDMESAGKSYEEWVNEDTLPQIIEREINSWRENQTKYEQEWLDPSKAPYSHAYNNEGKVLPYRSLDAALEAIDEYAAENALDEASAKGVKADYMRSIREGFIGNIESGLSLYTEANKDKLNIDSLYGNIVDLGITNFTDLMNEVDIGNLQEFKAAIQADNGRLAQLLSNFIEGEDIIDDSAEAFREFMMMLASMSSTYSNATSLSLIEQAEQAAKILEYSENGYSYQSKGVTPYSDDLTSIIGSSLTSKYGNGTISSMEDEYARMLINNASYGISGLTDVQKYQGMQQLMQLINSGNISQINGLDQSVINGYSSGYSAFANYLSMARIINGAGGEGFTIDQFNGMDKASEQYNIIAEALEQAGRSVEEFFEVQKELDAELKSNAVTAFKKYGDYAGDAASLITNIDKGGKTAVRQIAALNKQMLSLQDTLTATQKGRGKSGKALDTQTKSIIASYLGVDSKDIDKYTQEQLDHLLDQIETSVEEEFNKGQFQPMLQGAFEDINKAIEAGHITYEQVVDVVTQVNDSGDMSAFIELLNSINSDYASIAQSMAGNIASYFINIIKRMQGDKAQVDVVSSATSSAGRLGGGGSYHGSGGGGGGGGKSATDKLIEAQKRRMAAIEHENNMLQIESEDYARSNNVSMYESSINAQIAGQEKLRNAYKQNIEELKKQMNSVEKGSDDWYKLAEALYSAEEAYAKVAAAIDDLLAKMVSEQKELYDFNSSLLGHDKNMLDIWNSRMTRKNDYAGLNSNIDLQIANARAQLALDQGQAEYYANVIQQAYNRGETDSDNVRTWRQELNSLLEQIANSTETIADLEASRLAINQTQRNNELIIPQHVGNMLGYDEDTLTRNNSYSQLLSFYEYQRNNLLDQQAVYTASRDRNLELLSTKEIGTQDWLDVLSEVYADEEAIAELLLQIRDVASKRIQVIQDQYEQLFNDMTHTENMLQSKIESLAFDNDVDYFNKMNEYVGQKAMRERVLTKYINRLLEEQEIVANQYGKNSQEWRELESLIQSTQEEIASIQNEINSSWSSRLSELNEYYEHEASPLQHGLNMLGYDEQRASSYNNYDKYFDILQQENDINLQLNQTYANQIATLRMEQDIIGEQNDAWWERQKVIDSLTESIQKNTKAIEDNIIKQAEAVRKQVANEHKNVNHTADMLSLQQNRATILEDDEAYDATIQERLYNIRDIIAENNRSVATLEAELAEQIIGSDEWLKIRDDIWNYKKDTAQKENEAVQLEKELDELRLNRIKRDYQRESRYANHEMNVMNSYGQMYQQFGNYTGYRDTIERQIKDYQSLAQTTIAARDAALAQMATLEKGTQAWYNARDAVYEYDEALANITTTMLSKQLAIEASRIEELTNDYNQNNSLTELQLNVLRNQKQAFDDANDFENFQKYTLKEKELLEQQIIDKKAYVESMKQLLADTTINTDSWRNLRSQIINELASITSMELQASELSRQAAQKELDHLLEKIDWEDSNRKHNLTLIQYEQTRYQNANELTNYATMLQKENDLRNESIEANLKDIETLKAHQETLELGSKEYNQITKVIKEKEEAVKADTVAIEENTKKLKENQQAILKTRQELEKTVEDELKAREEERKKELSAAVKMENIILETIKDRYTQEWKLIKEDIDKKKDALNKEKSLINERLNARKKAAQQEDKYSELAMYQSQLALISNDPTRTKDAKELRKKIQDLQKDISWDEADQEAQASTEAIDDQISALNDYVTTNSENLEEMLADANNFADEIASIMAGGWESISRFLQENNESFKLSLDDAKREMLESWEQTWKDMKGIVDTYWDQINEILSSYESFIAFMQESKNYLNASDTGKALFDYLWNEMYEKYTSAFISSPEAVNYQTDTHPWYENTADTIVSDIFSALDLSGLNAGKAAPEIAISPVAPQVPSYSDVGVNKKDFFIDLSDIIKDDYYTNVGKTSFNIPEPIGVPNTDLVYKPVEVAEPELPDNNTTDYKPSFDTHEDVGQQPKPYEEPEKEVTVPVVPQETTPVVADKPEAAPEPEKKPSSNEGQLLSVKDIMNTAEAVDIDKAGPLNQTKEWQDNEDNWTNVRTGAVVPKLTEEEQKQMQHPTSETPQSVTIFNVIKDSNNASKGLADLVNNLNKGTTPSTTASNKKYHVSADSSKSFDTRQEAQDYIDFKTSMYKGGTGDWAKNQYSQWSKATISYYKRGGLVDYTGLAMVHGTEQDPEAYLSASDTAMMRDYLDAQKQDTIDVKTIQRVAELFSQALSSIKLPEFNIPSDYLSNHASYGDVTITINEAHLDSDADIEDVARKVGRMFTKELSKQGFGTAKYSF